MRSTAEWPQPPRAIDCSDRATSRSPAAADDFPPPRFGAPHTVATYWRCLDRATRRLRAAGGPTDRPARPDTPRVPDFVRGTGRGQPGGRQTIPAPDA